MVGCAEACVEYDMSEGSELFDDAMRLGGGRSDCSMRRVWFWSRVLISSNC